MITGFRQTSELSRSSGDSVACYILGEEGILFSQATGKLYRLNTTATFIWCCWEEGFTPSEIAGVVAERFGVSEKLARQDVARAFSKWKSHGLLSAGAKAADFPRAHTNEQPKEVKSLAVVARSLAHREHCYRLLDARFRIRYPSQATEKLIHPIIAHLKAHSRKNEHVVDVVLDIARNEAGYVLFNNGTPVSDHVQLFELVPIIHREMLVTAYKVTDCSIAIHAAAVCNEKNKCVLLPGAPGSGKSTLTAALMGAGFTYLTDELSLLTPDAHLIRPVPISLGLKRGSWPILAANHGSLRNLPIHFQPDNTEVRYLSPLKESLSAQETYSVDCLVFPKYEANRPTSLATLSSAEALYRVSEAGYAISGEDLTANHVEELIDWISQINAYELRMSDLSQAVHEIKELLA